MGKHVALKMSYEDAPPVVIRGVDAQGIGWEARHDAECGGTFYYNPATEETTPNEPRGFVPISSPNRTVPCTNELGPRHSIELFGVLEVSSEAVRHWERHDGTCRRRLSNRQSHEAPPAVTNTPRDCLLVVKLGTDHQGRCWELRFDPAADDTFYYSPATEETRRGKPHGFVINDNINTSDLESGEADHPRNIDGISWHDMGGLWQKAAASARGNVSEVATSRRRLLVQLAHLLPLEL